jgi:hypothetical protein
MPSAELAWVALLTIGEVVTDLINQPQETIGSFGDFIIIGPAPAQKVIPNLKQ